MAFEVFAVVFESALLTDETDEVVIIVMSLSHITLLLFSLGQLLKFKSVS